MKVEAQTPKAKKQTDVLKVATYRIEEKAFNKMVAILNSKYNKSHSEYMREIAMSFLEKEGVEL